MNKSLLKSQGPAVETVEKLSYLPLDLPDDVLTRLAKCLHFTDVLSLSQCCKLGYDVFGKDQQGIWRELCQRDWNHFTDVTQWINANDRNSATAYKSLYKLLYTLHDLIGHWTEVGTSPYRTVFTFAWGTGCMNGTKAVLGEYCLKVQQEPFFSICLGDRQLRIQTVCDEFCSVRMENEDEFGRLCTPSYEEESVAHAAGVYMGNTDSASPGSSPPGTYSYEMTKFLGGKQKPRKSRMKRIRSKFSEQIPLRHFQRIKVSAPTKRHPLGGLWLALFENCGTELVSIDYDFRGQRAHIVCSKVAGPGPMDQGEVIFKVQAHQKEGPFSLRQTSLMDDFKQQIYEEFVQDLQEGNDEDEFYDVGDLDVEVQQDIQTVQITSIHFGSGQVDGGLLPGVLWVYDNGGIGYVHGSQTDLPILVNFVRFSS